MLLFPLPPLNEPEMGVVVVAESPSGSRLVGLPNVDEETGGLINFNPLVSEGIDDEGDGGRCCC